MLTRKRKTKLELDVDPASAKKSKIDLEKTCDFFETISNYTCDLKLPSVPPATESLKISIVLQYLIKEQKLQSAQMHEPWEIIVAKDDDNNIYWAQISRGLVSYNSRDVKIAYVPIHLTFVDSDIVGETKPIDIPNLDDMLLDSDTQGHANALIIDTENKTAELFEPHGWDESWHDLVFQEISDLLQSRQIKLLDSEQYCPRVGPQQFKGDNFCSWWSWLHIYLKIFCPDVTIRQIHDYISRQDEDFTWKLLLGFYCYIQSVYDQKHLSKYLEFHVSSSSFKKASDARRLAKTPDQQARATKTSQNLFYIYKLLDMGNIDRAEKMISKFTKT